jgi:hypothetical protein
VKIGDALRQWWRDRGKGELFAPSDADLHELSEHLYYEVMMTFDLADVLNAAFVMPGGPPQAHLVRNALLEAFTIHVRQLVDFFWSERSLKWKLTQRGAYAADYFDPGEWKRLRPTRPQALDRVLTGKVGWGVAHLTYPRAHVTPTQKQWEPLKMCAALELAVRCFVDNVDPAKFDPQWFPHIEPCLDRFKAKYGAVTP